MLIFRAPAEEHLHRESDPEILEITVGKIGHKTPAALELNHTVFMRRIDRYGQHIPGERLDFGRNIGKFIIILTVEGTTIRIDTDVRFGELGGAAFTALAADQP